MASTDTKTSADSSALALAIANDSLINVTFAIVDTVWGSFLGWLGAEPALPESKAAAAAAEGPPPKPDRDRITAEIERHGYFRIDAKYQAAAKNNKSRIIMLVLDEDSPASKKVADLKKLLLWVQQDPAVKNGTLDRVMLIASSDFLKAKNLTEVVLGHNKAGGPRYSVHDHCRLTSNVMDHKTMPRRASIMPEAEVEKWRASQRLKMTDEPVFPASDPVVMYLGALPGDYIKLELDSELAGIKIDIRVVSK